MTETQQDVAVSSAVRDFWNKRRDLFEETFWTRDKKGRRKMVKMSFEDAKRAEIAIEFEALESVVRPLLERLAALDTESLNKYVMRVCDYARHEQGCDPIGASDLLHDLAQFTRNRVWYENAGFDEPAVVWADFEKRAPWYFPERNTNDDVRADN